MLYKQFFDLCLAYPYAKVIAMRSQAQGISDWTRVIEQLPRKKGMLVIHASFETSGATNHMVSVGYIPNSFIRLATTMQLQYASIILLQTDHQNFIICIG